MRLLFSLIISIYACSIHAQILEPVKWVFEKEQLSNDEYNLVFRANIQDGWTVYSQFTNDDGPVPTSINYDNPEMIELLGDAAESGKKKSGFDKIFEVDVIKFLSGEEFVITQKVKVKDNTEALVGYLTFMTCDDSKCLPPKDLDFEFDFKQSNSTVPADAQSSTSDIDSDLSLQDQHQVEEKEVLKKEAPKSELKTQEINPIEGSSAVENSVLAASDSDEILDPVKWELSLNQLENNIYELKCVADIHPDWNAYSMKTPEGGPLPTELAFESDEGFSLIGEPIEQGNMKEQNDPLFDNIRVIKVLPDEPYVITQRIKVDDPSKQIIGYLSYMACDKSHCLPPTDVEFNFDVETGNNLALVENSSLIDVGPNIDGNVLDQRINSIQDSYEEPIAECGTQIKSADGNLWSIFLGGFLGGLVAILLPCIFPMIPITVSFFTKDNKRKGWVNGLIYGLSIIVIFVAIGLMVTALLGPEALNRLSTNWLANVIFFLIFVAFAISFFGYFEITLPSSWSTRSDQMADRGGFLGIFFMAATLAIVSFSCTGPIIGTALVQVAGSGSYLGPFVIMFGFSLALAIPFGLFAAFPSWLNSLPRSGSWMNSVKVVLGFLELALALKFLSVADMTSNWDFLKYELFMGLWVLIFAAMTAYLFGLFRFPHDSPNQKLGVTRKAFATLSLVWTMYIASGFMFNPEINAYTIPKLVSGITPPASYNFFIEKNNLDTSIKEKYPSYSKCANDINCFKDYYDGIAYANEVNKPVLLDFTGYGCVNCRKTEDYIWKDPEVKSKLNDDYILVSLYVDDRKKLPETLVSKVSGEKMRNVGNKWADFQIVNFKQNSQPLYVPITPDQQVITAPRGYEEGVENYKQFLDCGLENYQSLSN